MTNARHTAPVGSEGRPYLRLIADVAKWPYPQEPTDLKESSLKTLNLTTNFCPHVFSEVLLRLSMRGWSRFCDIGD